MSVADSVILCRGGSLMNDRSRLFLGGGVADIEVEPLSFFSFPCSLTHSRRSRSAMCCNCCTRTCTSTWPGNLFWHSSMRSLVLGGAPLCPRLWSFRISRLWTQTTRQSEPRVHARERERQRGRETERRGDGCSRLKERTFHRRRERLLSCAVWRAASRGRRGEEVHGHEERK